MWALSDYFDGPRPAEPSSVGSRSRGRPSGVWEGPPVGDSLSGRGFGFLLDEWSGCCFLGDVMTPPSCVRLFT
jgi:hypothetical protein